MGLRIRSLVSLAMVLLAIGLLGVTAVLAAVTTDQADYVPGSVVTISGDNSDGAGYLAGETVHVDVSGPNGYAASCEAVADEAGAWSCQVTLWDSELAEGAYTYTATGLTSGVRQTGSFTDHGLSPVTAGSYSISADASHLISLSVVLGGGSSTVTLTAATMKVANVTDGGTTDVALTGPGGNGNGTWSGSSQGLCEKTYKINNVKVTWTTTHDHDSTQTPGTVQVTTDACAPANTAPVVAFSSPPTTANEGDTKTFNFAITDAASDTHTFATGFPDCGSEGTLVTSSESINNTTHTGTFQCLFPDGLDPAVDSTVRVRVQDQGPLTSNIATTDVTVSNVAPTVVAGFTAVSVNCQTTAMLTINPDDVGVNDSPWKVNINWGDLNTEPEISRTSLNSFTVTHVYALAGVYNATVSVTDKDNATGSDNTNGITVNQTYSASFLAPMDGSSPSYLITNTMKSGRVVPVKVRVTDTCTGSAVTDLSSATLSIRITDSSTAAIQTDGIEQYVDAGSANGDTLNFRWTPNTTNPPGFWIYNLDSKSVNGLALVVNTTYKVEVKVTKAITGCTSGCIANPTFALLKPVK